MFIIFELTVCLYWVFCKQYYFHGYLFNWNFIEIECAVHVKLLLRWMTLIFPCWVVSLPNKISGPQVPSHSWFLFLTPTKARATGTLSFLVSFATPTKSPGNRYSLPPGLSPYPPTKIPGTQVPSPSWFFSNLNKSPGYWDPLFPGFLWYPPPNSLGNWYVHLLASSLYSPTKSCMAKNANNSSVSRKFAKKSSERLKSCEERSKKE
jgi:hypothetical protein